MAEFVTIAVVFFIAGLLVGLPWRFDGDVKITEPSEHGGQPL